MGFNFPFNAGPCAQPIGGGLTLSGDLTIQNGDVLLGDSGVFGWTNDPNTYIARTSADAIDIYCGGSAILSASSAGDVTSPRVRANEMGVINGGDFSMSAGGQILADSGSQAEPGYAYVGDTDTGRFRSAANVEQWIVGNGVSIIVSASGVFTYIPQYFESSVSLKEMTAPVGATDYTRLFSQVDGGGKTDLMAIFQSGAAQTITQEP